MASTKQEPKTRKNESLSFFSLITTLSRQLNQASQLDLDLVQELQKHLLEPFFSNDLTKFMCSVIIRFCWVNNGTSKPKRAATHHTAKYLKLASKPAVVDCRFNWCKKSRTSALWKIIVLLAPLLTCVQRSVWYIAIATAAAAAGFAFTAAVAVVYSFLLLLHAAKQRYY